MSLKISEKANVNYLAKVIILDNLRKHSNADRLQVATIDGNNVITSLAAKDGMMYIYFPLESAINLEYLSYSNAFQAKELNKDTEVKGYFHKTGRVRATNLRGEKSEGYMVPASDISNWLKEVYNIDFQFTQDMVNTEFDLIGDILVCKKYINYKALQQSNKEAKNKNKKAKVSRLVESQFHFHIDTLQLKKSITNVNPNDYIQITRKLHGTSAVISKILCVKPLKWYEKLLKRLGFNIVDTEYDLVYSSRKVVKNGYLDPSEANHNHYYSSDVWGDCAKKYEQFLKPGISLYGEIVGFTSDGAYIQKGYDYGCSPNTFDFYVYRVTYTSPNGDVYEMSPAQMKHYCDKYGIKTVPEIYYGKARDLYGISVNDHWHQNFLDNLCNAYLEKTCDMCKENVPDEGICLRIDKPLDIDIYKMKSFAFLERETKLLDEGEVDLETTQSEVES
jgi:hypothetical protein